MNEQPVDLILNWAERVGLDEERGRPGRAWPAVLPRRAWKNFRQLANSAGSGDGFVGSQKLAVCYHALERRTPAEREEWRGRKIGELLAASKGEPLGFLPPLAVYPRPLGEGKSSFLAARLGLQPRPSRKDERWKPGSGDARRLVNEA